MSNPLREGFLVKKGHFRQNWRTRWFVLREETLSYFRKREDANPAGVIRLKDCSLVCLPPGHDSKHPWTIRLSTAEGVLYLIKAPDLEARDAWAHSIAQCIRSLDSSTSVAQSEAERVQAATSTFCHYETSDIVQAMQDPSGGVPLEVSGRPAKGAPHYFTGASLVEWLVKWSFARTSKEAKKLGSTLLLEGHIKMVNMHLLERSGSFSCCSTDQGELVDSRSQYYIFALFAPPEPLELFQEESDSDSETEQTPCLTVQESREDSVVKQGFLLRKSEGKRVWKPRRFVLSKDSDQLVFYRGSKGKYPLGCIPLRGSSIVVGAGQSQSQSDSEDEHGAATLTVITGRGLMYHLQPASAEELRAWHCALTDTIRTLDVKQEH